MAELKLDLSRVDQEVSSEGGVGGGGETGEEMDPLGDMYNSMDERLPPVEKLERYFQSEDVMDREVAVRCIIDAVEMATTYSEYQLILEITMTLANDHEPTIRMSILDTVSTLLVHHPQLCQGETEESSLENEERLFDVPVRMVSDINQQVRRMGQNCIINLLEEEKRSKDILVMQLLPEMVRCLRRDENYDLRMDMALLLSRLAPLLGRPVLVKYFVPLFPSLGSDAMFHVRKAFAMGCKELCPVLGEDITEQSILPIFLKLCRDDVWGVRKACADVFSEVSSCCNLGTRHDTLTPSFLRLLQDESRWVRKAAFQYLGSFIATFYVPELSATPPCDESSLDPLGDSVLMDNSLLTPSSYTPSPPPDDREEGEGGGESNQQETKSNDEKNNRDVQAMGNDKADIDREKVSQDQQESIKGERANDQSEPFFYFSNQQGPLEDQERTDRNQQEAKADKQEVTGRPEGGEIPQLHVDPHSEDSSSVESKGSESVEKLVLDVGGKVPNEGGVPVNHQIKQRTNSSEEVTTVRTGESSNGERVEGDSSVVKGDENLNRESGQGESESCRPDSDVGTREEEGRSEQADGEIESSESEREGSGETPDAEPESQGKGEGERERSKVPASSKENEVAGETHSESESEAPNAGEVEKEVASGEPNLESGTAGNDKDDEGKSVESSGKEDALGGSEESRDSTREGDDGSTSGVASESVTVVGDVTGGESTPEGERRTAESVKESCEGGGGGGGEGGREEGNQSKIEGDGVADSRTSEPDTSSTPGQATEGGVDTSSTPGQVTEGGVDASSTPGQVTESGVDASSTPGQVTEGGVDASSTPGQATEGGVDASSTPGQATEGGVDASSTPGQATEGGVDASSTPGQATEGGVDASSTPGQATEGGVDASSTPGQVTEGGVDASSTPGQATEGGVDASSTPGQVTEGGVDASSTPGQATEGGVDASSTPGQVTEGGVEGERQPSERQSSEEAASQSATPQSFPPVRLLLHTAAGHVMEPECHDDGAGFHDSGTHDTGQDFNVSMDMTLATMSDTNPNMDLTHSGGNPFLEDFQPQEIVPDELMDLYLSMTDSTKSQTVDSDLPYYCAFCLPGVLLTLGFENWAVLKPTFDVLCGDLQWKIRRVLAYSLHELAHILGTETTVTDLYPTFEEYCTKDVDDVKVGILTHLTEFFEMLPSDLQRSCLPIILDGLLEVENPKNWRYRNSLAEQLVSLCDYYDADYLHSHIYPVAKQLTEDRVAQVRHSASELLGVILQRLTQITPDGYLPLLREMKADYATHTRWNFRQLYIKQCVTFLIEGCISCEVFVAECLPSLLTLVADKVPNVRLSLAKTIKESLVNIDYFRTDGKQTLNKLQSVLTMLQSDRDRDVTYFAGGDVTSFHRPHPFNEVRGRSYSQVSEDQYHDAVESMEGWRFLNEASLLQTWEEALAGPALQMQEEIS